MSDDEVIPRKKRKRRIKVMPLNLAPLIDINANLLFFLIVANSVQEDRLKAGENIELPPSTSQAAEAGDLISLVIGLNDLSVNEVVVMQLKNGEFQPTDVETRKNGGVVVSKVFVTLTQRFQDLIKKGAQPGAADDDDSKLPVVLIQADKRLPYQTVKQIMFTCGEAGFTKFRFAARAAGGQAGPPP